MSAALSGIRVIDLTRGPAGGLASMVLADFGAEVMRVVHPGRADPFAKLGAAPMWQRGKQILPLDLDAAADRTVFHQLCAAADVLICNWRTSAMRRKAMQFSDLNPQHPHLIVCHISGFGSRGPLADMPGYEHVVAAYSGRMHTFAGTVDRDGPVFSALQVGVHACAQAAASGILAALYQRDADGAGRLVETSMLAAMLPYEQGPMLGAQFPQMLANLLPAMQATSKEPPMPSLYYHPAQAGDGRWMQFGNLLPHLFDNFLLATGLSDIVADPDFDAKQLNLPPEKQEAFRQRMLERIQQRSAADWMADLIADGGVVASAYQTTQQAMQDPDIVANGHVLEDERGAGQLGPLAHLTRTPGQPAPLALPAAATNKNNNKTDWLASWQATPRARPSRTADNVAPLQGVKVVELATIIAAPMGASLLADLGAQVTKVEQLGGDPYRSMGAGIGSARVNSGKRSLCIDLKSSAGKEIVLKLIAEADVLIHNFRPGVPERLGIGYDQVAQINPQLVYLQSNGYGPHGPSAMRPSTHPVPGAAMGGVMYQMGERLPGELQDFAQLCLWTRRLMRANEVNPDPNTAMVVATSVLLGLVSRQRNGRGQQIYIDMFGANAYANHDDFQCYPGKPPRPMPDAEGFGLGPLYRLYRCDQAQWVFLAIPTVAEQRTFIEISKRAGNTPPSAPVLAAADATTAAALAAMFATASADYWQDLFGPADIGCVRADGALPSEFWLADPQAAASGLTVAAEHPQWGSYRRHGPMQIFDGGDNRIQLAGPPLAGGQNAALLAALGYSPAEISELQRAGVVWQDAAVSRTPA